MQINSALPLKKLDLTLKFTTSMSKLQINLILSKTVFQQESLNLQCRKIKQNPNLIKLGLV